MLEAANRHERYLRLVVPGEQDQTERVGDYGLIYYIKSPHSPLFDNRYRLILPHKYLPPFAGSIQKIIAMENPDLVEVCDKYSLNWLSGFLRRQWIRGLNRPVTVGLSCERMDDNVRAYISSGNIAESLTRFYLGQMHIPLFDYHIACSAYTADELLDAMRPPHERPVYIRPMGADIESFDTLVWNHDRRNKLISKFHGNNKTKLLLYAGRISKEKNIQLLLDMMRNLSSSETLDFRLIVAGSGPLENWFKSETAKSITGKIHTLGHISDKNELMSLYADCDAFVHPNPREPFGIAPLEAMAAGLPLVAPDKGGVLSYANATNAWLAEPNGEAFAQAVISICSDNELRIQKITDARKTAQIFKWETVSAKFFDLYDNLYDDFHSAQYEHNLETVELRIKN